MNTPFIWFIIAQVFFCGVLFLFWRNTIAALSRQAAAHAGKHAITYAKGAILVFGSFATMLIDCLSSLSPDIAAVLPWWGWVVIFLKPFLAGALTLGAYLDGSVQKAREQLPTETKP